METEFAVAVHYLAGLRTREKILVADSVGDLDRLRTLDQRECESIIRRRIASFRYDSAGSVDRALRDVEVLDREGFSVVWMRDDSYPPLLREIHDPPVVLFARGTVPAWTVPSVAIVGTRYPTGAGRSGARRLGAEFASSGIPVVSGLAYGIDEEAHRGVVAHDGCAVAVLGNGIDTVCPPGNRELARRIVGSGGSMLSEYGPGETPRKYYFPARNRIIAGISRATVVVEAPARSGALITAEFELDDGRDLFVHRDGVTGPNREGAAALADDGARVIEHASDIFREWSIEEELSLPAPRMN